MVMSIQTLDSAAQLMSVAVLVDHIDLYDVGPLVTVGFETERELTLVESDIPALVQGTVLQNAIESMVSTTWSVKVERGTDIAAGQAIRVTECRQEPDLVGKVLYLDKVSQNGLAILRKAIASDFYAVDQQGKDGN